MLVQNLSRTVEKLNKAGFILKLIQMISSIAELKLLLLDIHSAAVFAFEVLSVEYEVFWHKLLI